MSEPQSGVTSLFETLVKEPAPDGAPGAAPPRRRRWPFVVAALVVIALVLAGGAWFAVRQAVARYDRNIERFADPSAQIPVDERPADPAPAAMNVLLLGSDSRISAGDPTQWTSGAQRTDAIMLVHVQADRKSVQAISIPRDSWVPIPGRGTAKINAAFSWGGPALMVRTVEALTGVKVDHVAIADFEGFKKLTNDLGGVDLRVAKATSDMRASWTAGVHHMNGEQALDYVRQRYNLPGGDFDRVRRQQAWLRAVIAKLRASGTLTNPLALDRALTTLSTSVATDSSFDIDAIGDLVTSLARLDHGQMRFLTMPTAGTGTSKDGQSIVNVDRVAAGRLFTAVRDDTVQDWIRTYRPDLLGSVVR